MLQKVKTVHPSENCKKTVIMRMIQFNDMKTVSEAFLNMKCYNGLCFEFLFNVYILRLPLVE